MNYQKNRKKIIKELLNESDKELSDEELISEILSTSVTENEEKTKGLLSGKRRRMPRLNLREVGRLYSVLLP